jgi:hypothetical protein
MRSNRRDLPCILFPTELTGPNELPNFRAVELVPTSVYEFNWTVLRIAARCPALPRNRAIRSPRRSLWNSGNSNFRLKVTHKSGPRAKTTIGSFRCENSLNQHLESEAFSGSFDSSFCRVRSCGLAQDDRGWEYPFSRPPEGPLFHSFVVRAQAGVPVPQRSSCSAEGGCGPRLRFLAAVKHKVPPAYSRADDCAHSHNGCRDDGSKFSFR